MALWAVVCTNCDSKITHSQVPDRGLAELFIPERPQVPVDATIRCPKCQNVVTNVRTDLQYVANG